VDLSKYLALYLEDGRDHLAALREGLHGEWAPDGAAVQELFRHAHSLKGMAASMGFEATAALSHALEDLLGAWRSGAAVSAGAPASAVRALDLLEALTDRVQQDGSDAGLEAEAAACATQLREAAGKRGEGSAAPAPMPLQRPETAAPSAEAPAVVTVTIDGGSALPAARLLVVGQHLQKRFGACAMEPALAEIQAAGLRCARFRVPAGPGLKEAALALRQLPEVTDVVLTLPGDAEEERPESSLTPHVRIPATELDELLSGTADLLHHLNALEAGLSRVERHRRRFWLEEHRGHLNRLFDHVLSVRLVPFSLLTERLARLVRDLEARTGKPLRFEVSGEDQQVDRALLDRLLDPLTHLLRNAADHGVESPVERAAAGKPEMGHLELEIRRDGEALLLSVVDDGRGLDVAAVARAAVERGLLSTQEAALLPRERLLDLITLPAFSTRREVSTLSGRGVGLDAARAAAESLGGRLEMETTVGRGTRFTLVIPSAATLTRVLVFGWDGPQRFALPASQVRRICALSAHPLIWSGASRRIEVDGALVPVLAWRGGPVGREGCALVVATSEGERALLVSDVYQSERVVVHPWGPPLDRVLHWVGGALLSTGELAFVVDGRALARREGEPHDVS